MNTPHDEFFHKAFDDPNRARELLRVALGPHISSGLNLQDLEVERGSFVDPWLRRSQSDLLLQTTTGGAEPLLVYVLFEHKSSPDPRTPFQLLRYMVRVWERWVSKKENRTWRSLPPIIPVVFSHAPQRWSSPVTFASLVAKPEGMDLSPYTPSFSALLLDLAATGTDELGQDRLVRALLELLKHIQASSAQQLRPALTEISELGLQERDKDLLEAILNYLFRGRHGESAQSILEAVPMGELRRRAMTIAERLERKGRRQGRIEGRQEGKLEGKLEGRQEGKLEGRQEGKLEGRIEEKQDLLERQLDRKFGLTEGERKAIRSHTDPRRLDAALDVILFATSKEEVLGHLR